MPDIEVLKRPSRESGDCLQGKILGKWFTVITINTLNDDVLFFNKVINRLYTGWFIISDKMIDFSVNGKSASSHHPVVDYFPTTAYCQVFSSVFTWSSMSTVTLTIKMKIAPCVVWVVLQIEGNCRECTPAKHAR